MSRTILFKAKLKGWREDPEKNRWVEGSLYCQNEHTFILESPMNIGENSDGSCWIDDGIYPVDPETVCQYVGMTDKKGRKIFEKDIVRVITFGFDPEKFVTEIKFGPRAGVQGFYLANGRMMFYFGQTDLTKMDDAEIIGNSIDNPELVEVQDA